MKDRILKLKILKLMMDEAERGVKAQWENEIKNEDLDGNYCCDGEMCGCGAMSKRQYWCGEWADSKI